MCDLIVYESGQEIICERTWRDWKKRLGVTVTESGNHDGGTFFLMRLMAEYKKKYGSRAVTTRQALVEFARKQDSLSRVSPKVIEDLDFKFAGRMFPAIAYHITGHQLSESYLYELFRTRLNIPFKRSTEYTVKRAEELLSRLGYPILRLQRKKSTQAAEIIDSVLAG